MKSNLKAHLTVEEFYEIEDGFKCEYTLDGEEKIFYRKPIAMANILVDYGFVSSYYPANDTVYVRYTPLDEDERIDLIDDFMDSLSQFHAYLIIEEFELRRQQLQERADAFEKSFKKFSKVG